MPIRVCNKPQRLIITTLSLIALSMSSACSVFGIESVEEAPYELVSKDNQFEIRQYAPLVVAQTLVSADYDQAGKQAFRKLFKYISGDNNTSAEISMTAPVIADGKVADNGESIAMTAPVTAAQEGAQWRYRFVLPDNYTIDTAPKPLNPEVTLVAVPSKRVASVQYSGRATQKARRVNAESLSTWIEAQGLKTLSEPRWAGYNPPFTIPWFRRNEVLIDVDAP